MNRNPTEPWNFTRADELHPVDVFATHALPGITQNVTLDSIREMFAKLKSVPPVKLPLDFHFVQSPYLPKTVKDKDGIEYELLGVMMPSLDPARALDPDYPPGPIQLLCGDIVSDAPTIGEASE